MKETRNWLEMPHEIMGGMILQRLGAVEILESAQKVCTTWRRICKDPAMWKLIDISHRHARNADYDILKLIKQAVDRSCGELMDISLEGFGTHDLIDYISRCSSKLNRLHLSNCLDINGCGLKKALKRLPHLETLELSYISICAEDIEVIGRNCPQLKSFKMKTDFMGFYGDDVHAIASSMPALRYLKLDGSTMDNDDGVRAILNGCPHLESLDLRGCFYLHLDGNLEKLCRERIKDFKFKRNNIPQIYWESDDDIINEWNDGMDLYEDDGMYDCGFSGGSTISAEDDYDFNWLASPPVFW